MRPMNPRHASAHTLCIAERRSRSSRVRGTMKLMPTRSPVAGDGNVMVSTRSGRCWRSYSAANECAALVVRGCVVGSSTNSPSTHKAGGSLRSRSRTCCPVRAPICTLLSVCSIIEHMIRISNDTLAPSQTLDRGLLCLELIAGADRPLSVDTTAATLGLHRSIVYRLLRTLERRHLVERNDEGDYVPGPYLAVLSRGVRRNLRSAATPVLAGLCAQLQMTAFLVVADGEEAVTIDSVEPTSLDAHVAYRPGTRHPIDRGAPGIALLAGRPACSGERKEVIAARARGWAESEAEGIAGMASIAAPIADQGAIAVLWLAGTPVDVERVAAAVVTAAADVARRLTL